MINIKNQEERKELRKLRRRLKRKIEKIEKLIAEAEESKRPLLISEKLVIEYLLSAIDNKIKYLVSIERGGGQPETLPEPVSAKEIKQDVLTSDEGKVWSYILELRRQASILNSRIYGLSKKYEQKKSKSIYREILTTSYKLALLRREKQLYYLFLLAKKKGAIDEAGTTL